MHWKWWIESFGRCLSVISWTCGDHLRCDHRLGPDYCRASHTGDAGRDRGRERERGMSSELANMTC